MPKVEQFGPSRVSTDVSRGARARAGVPAAAFGIGGEGIQALGRGIAQFQQRRDTTAAEEALVSFERQKNDLFFNPKSGYFNLQGRDAHDGAQTANEALVELQKQHADSLESEQARNAFKRASDAHITSSNRDILRHASSGLRAWEVATIDAQTENAIEDAALYWNDPDKLRVQNARGRESVILAADMQGITGGALNERLQNYESAFARTSIAAATTSSATAGQQALDKMGDRLEGPDKIKLESAIAKKVKAEKTQRDATLAVATATNLNDKFTSRSDIIEEVNKIKDPDLRKKTMTESMHQFSLQKQADSEGQAESYSRGIDHINKGGTAASFQATDPEGWEDMSAAQRNNLLNGKHMITDQVKLNNLLTLPPTELATVNVADHVSDFAPADVTKLRSAVTKAKRGQSISVVQSLAAKSKSIATQFFGPERKRNKDEMERSNELLNQIQNAVQDAEEFKGGKLTPRETDELLGDFSRRIVVERSIGGFDFLARDIELDVSNVPPAEIRAMNTLIDQVGVENTSDIVAIRKLLIDNGVPVTNDTLLKAYQQATQ